MGECKHGFSGDVACVICMEETLDSVGTENARLREALQGVYWIGRDLFLSPLLDRKRDLTIASVFNAKLTAARDALGLNEAMHQEHDDASE